MNAPSSAEIEQQADQRNIPEHGKRRYAWLWGLGISALLLVIICASSFSYVIYKSFAILKGITEIEAMEPWPNWDIPPDYLVRLDLSALGLEPDKVMDANKEEWAKPLNSPGGIYKRYKRGDTPVVDMWSFWYPDGNAAVKDFAALQVWGQEACESYEVNTALETGIIYCGNSDSYREILWNGQWIVAIDAKEGTEYPPDVLVDKIRDAMADHWGANPRDD